MRHIQCEGCGAKAPMNDAFTVLDRTLCESCADQEIARFQSKEIPEKVVQALVDPTVCALCETDCGGTELPTVAGLPMCETCRDFVENRPFPAWVKVSFVLLIVLAGLAFVWNFRFFKAYQERQQGIRAWQAGDVQAAAQLLTSVAERVPGSQGAALDAKMVRGIYLMSQDKCAEAVPVLRECRRAYPKDKFIHTMLLRAEIGVAFDKKDYDGFLKNAQMLRKLNPRDAQSVGNVASAYACKYAVTGEEQFKKEALAHLEKARRLAGKNNPDFQEYEERIRHRLKSREIISYEEYHRRFPKGKKEAAKK